jgi:hypothetical protein
MKVVPKSVVEGTERFVRKTVRKENEKYERRRYLTQAYFERKLYSDYALKAAYEHALQLLLEGSETLDYGTMEEIVQQNAPTATWHERAREEFLAKRRAQEQEKEDRREAREQAQKRERFQPQLPAYWQNQMNALSDQIQGWPEEAQYLAQGLLWKWYELRKQAFPSNPALPIPGVEAGIEATIRKDLVTQFEQVLRAADKTIHEECSKDHPYWMMKIHGDPCVSLFAPAGRAESALSHFERRMKIFRDEDGVPYKTVFFWVEEYMKQQVPTSMGGRYLELLEARAQLVGAFNLAAFGAKPALLTGAAGEASVGEGAASEAAAGEASVGHVSAGRAPTTVGNAPDPLTFPRTDLTLGRAFPPPEIEPPASAPPAQPTVAGAESAEQATGIGRWLRSKVLEYAIRGADASEVAPRVGAGGPSGGRPVAANVEGWSRLYTPTPDPVTTPAGPTRSVSAPSTETAPASSVAQQPTVSQAPDTQPAPNVPSTSRANAGGPQAPASRTPAPATLGPQVETLPRPSRPFQPEYTAGPTVNDVRAQYRYRTYQKNGKTYKQASGRLGMPREVVEHRDPWSQTQVSQGTGDDAGHLIGNRFGASGEEENLSRQNWIANRFGNYKALEDLWAEMRHRGIEIDVWVTDVTKAGEDRPFWRNVKWTEYYLDGMEIEHEVDFANTSSQKSRAAEAQANPKP